MRKNENDLKFKKIYNLRLATSIFMFYSLFFNLNIETALYLTRILFCFVFVHADTVEPYK